MLDFTSKSYGCPELNASEALKLTLCEATLCETTLCEATLCETTLCEATLSEATRPPVLLWELAYNFSNKYRVQRLVKETTTVCQ